MVESYALRAQLLELAHNKDARRVEELAELLGTNVKGAACGVEPSPRWVKSVAGAKIHLAVWAIEQCRNEEVLREIATSGPLRERVREALGANAALSDVYKEGLSLKNKVLKGPDPLTSLHAAARRIVGLALEESASRDEVYLVLAQLIEAGEPEWVDRLLTRRRGAPWWLVSDLLDLAFLPWTLDDQTRTVLQATSIEPLDALSTLGSREQHSVKHALLMRLWGSGIAPIKKVSTTYVTFASAVQEQWWTVVARPLSHVEWMDESAIAQVMATPSLWKFLDISALSDVQRDEVLESSTHYARNDLASLFSSERAYPFLSLVLDATEDDVTYLDGMDFLAHMTRASWTSGEWGRLLKHLSPVALSGLVLGSPSVFSGNGDTRVHVQVRDVDMRAAVDSMKVVEKERASAGFTWAGRLADMNEASGRELLRILPGLAAGVTPENSMFAKWAGEEIYSRLLESGATLEIGIEMMTAHPELSLEEVCDLVRRLRK